MLSPYSHLPTSPLLPDSLQQLFSSRAPGDKLAVSISDTRPFRNGQEAEIASLWLTEDELRQLERFSFDKRRSEWISGRICAKQAALDFLNKRKDSSILEPHDIIINTSPSGRPYLRVNSQDNPDNIDISISHSHEMAVSIAANGHCGVDIQHLNETLFKVRQRYCADFETAILDEISGDELLQLGLLWVAKEAVRKCLSSVRLVGFLEIKLEGISKEDGYHLLNFQLDDPFTNLGTLSVATHVHGTYALAVCTIARERLDA